MANIINGINCNSAGKKNVIKYTEGYAVNGSGALVANSTYCATDYIPMTASSSVTFSPLFVDDTVYFCIYDSSKKFLNNWQCSAASRTLSISGNPTCAYCRMTFKKADADNVKIFDNTNSKLIFMGSLESVYSFK